MKEIENSTKIHRVDKVIEVQDVLNSPTELTHKVLIKQIDENNEVLDLYRFEILLPHNVNLSPNQNSYEINVYAPHLTKDGSDYIKTVSAFSEKQLGKRIEYLIEQFKRGYIWSGYISYPSKGSYHFKLSYKGVKLILRREKHSSYYYYHKAIKYVDPKMIANGNYSGRIDCNCGIIIFASSYGLDRYKYSCTTFNEKTSEWINNSVLCE